MPTSAFIKQGKHSTWLADQSNGNERKLQLTHGKRNVRSGGCQASLHEHLLRRHSGLTDIFVSSPMQVYIPFGSRHPGTVLRPTMHALSPSPLPLLCRFPVSFVITEKKLRKWRGAHRDEPSQWNFARPGPAPTTLTYGARACGGMAHRTKLQELPSLRTLAASPGLMIRGRERVLSKEASGARKVTGQTRAACARFQLGGRVLLSTNCP